jgi:hypothetical protein
MNKIILIIWDFNKEETLMTNKRFFFILSLIHFYNNQHIDGKTMKVWCCIFGLFLSRFVRRYVASFFGLSIFDWPFGIL